MRWEAGTVPILPLAWNPEEARGLEDRRRGREVPFSSLETALPEKQAGGVPRLRTSACLSEDTVWRL